MPSQTANMAARVRAVRKCHRIAPLSVNTPADLLTQDHCGLTSLTFTYKQTRCLTAPINHERANVYFAIQNPNKACKWRCKRGLQTARKSIQKQNKDMRSRNANMKNNGKNSVEILACSLLHTHTHTHFHGLTQLANPFLPFMAVIIKYILMLCGHAEDTDWSSDHVRVWIQRGVCVSCGVDYSAALSVSASPLYRMRIHVTVT